MGSNWQSEASKPGLFHSTTSILFYHIIASRKFCFLKPKACFFSVHVVESMAMEGPRVLLITVQTLREKLISFF